MNKKVFTVILVTGFIFISSIKAQNFVVNEQLIGRWELCTPDGKIMKIPNVRQKIYTNNSYVVLEVDKDNNTAVVDFIGTVVAQSEDRIIETPVLTHFAIKNMLFQNFSFLYKIEGNYLYLSGINNMFNEIWVKISD